MGDLVRMAKATQGHKKGLKPQKRRKVCCDEGEQRSVDTKAQSKLHDVCSRLLGRDIQPGDIIHDLVVNNTGIVGNLRLPCILSVDGAREVGQRVWSSPPC